MDNSQPLFDRFQSRLLEPFTNFGGLSLIDKALVVTSGLYAMGLLSGWNLGVLLVGYWAETLIVGCFTALRILATVTYSWAAIPTLFFFLAHFGIFCSVHGVFVLQLFWPSAKPFIVESPLFAASLIAFAASQGLAFVSDVGNSAHVNPNQLFSAPYPRVITLHMAILASAFFLRWLNIPAIAFLPVLLVKLALDRYFQQRERSAFLTSVAPAQTAPTSPPAQ